MWSDPRFSRRFALSLAAALALHGLALYGLRLPAPAGFSAVSPVVEVTLMPAIPAVSVEMPGAAAPLLRRRARSTAHSPMAAAPQSPAGQPAELSQVPSQREYPPAIADPTWRDTARVIIREEARRLPDGTAPAAPETLEARFAMALRKAPPSERRLADGILKITTPSGTTYCIQPQPDATRDGPGERYGITVTCP